MPTLIIASFWDLGQWMTRRGVATIVTSQWLNFTDFHVHLMHHAHLHCTCPILFWSSVAGHQDEVVLSISVNKGQSCFWLFMPEMTAPCKQKVQAESLLLVGALELESSGLILLPYRCCQLLQGPRSKLPIATSSRRFAASTGTRCSE
jgi:hypothetical protein